MCPPTLVVLLARATMAMAFHRIRLLILRSTSRSPGYGTSWSLGTVFRYGVWMLDGPSMPAAWARSMRASRRNWARSGPWARRTASRDSTHSAVSWGSTSTYSLDSGDGRTWLVVRTII